MKNLILKFVLVFCLFYFTSLMNAYSGKINEEKNQTINNPFPEWAKGIVWYQIFPERFENGDTSNDPTAERVFSDSHYFIEDWEITPWTQSWFAKDKWMEEKGSNDVYLRRYGGDIQGIINRLDYLKELGIKAIYLNPVFDAVSLHKYDGSTFHHIDKNFGPNPFDDAGIIDSEVYHDPSTWKWTNADKLFLQLIEEVHKRDMKIIIDGVFNHTGRNFWAFKDLLKNGENSIYKNWYRVESFDNPKTEENELKYKGWWNIASLPEINRSENDLHKEPKKYIFDITKRWMDPNNDGDPSDGIDGWRLDVANEVPIGFWRDWNIHVKSLNKNAIIIGELWELSPDFVGIDKPFDGLMNYNFAFAVNNFFIAQKKKISKNEFINQLKTIDETYPEKTLFVIQNLMNSHDTDRLLSMIKNPDRNYDRDAGSKNPVYDPSKPNSEDYQVQKMIVAFQMTYRGAPMIYYGDEVGMWGADDPHCRKPMVWNDKIYDDEIIDETSGFNKGFGAYTVKQNEDILSTYKKLITIRNNHKSLTEGSLTFLNNLPGDVICFARELNQEKIYTVFNFSDKEITIDFIEGSYTDLYNEAEIELSNNKLNILPNSFLILKAE